ncbi:MAG: regulatory protein UhpC [Candidatus Methanofastidiosum methylothiophilum]|jgi:sugar phosphate permease|uniref:Regulatory protein UhpC n=1 Tax=Candidatus Methanofastidiosum methylothiophilum TaxID=1705564 RepID=A0A150JML4_9EURY|nr:MAG: regulatory protein UhpC [Candidatus Methanofastidiosum methylthiophilus]MBP6932411.1 MFS transporter [Methanofastidiosum sp.]OQC52285.1 MAG: regulatory protein UhpC [Euryarchaeota archaeon ADurb.Bin023]KYC57596.1 MAG: regulatory protein UhpC [Candidatus Methanofastidiosum methylthiophilus]KYC58515.1 MAG: regulatory protein UhpC [Candidatus Methanofastidiosum methylthiophilus]
MVKDIIFGLSEKKYRWILLFTLLLVYFFVYFHRVSSAVISKDLLHEFGVSALSLGLLSSMYFYSYSLFQIPVGIFSDTIGPRKTIAFLTIFSAIGSFLFGMALNFNMALFARLIIGIGVSGVWIPALKLFSVWYSKREYATIVGILLAVGNLGAVSASYPLALIVNDFGWRYAFYVIGIISIFLAVISWIFIRDSPEAYLNKNKEVEGPKSISKKQYLSREHIKLIFKNKDVWILSIWLFVAYGALLAYQGLWAYPYFRDVYNLSKATSGFILMFVSIGMLLGSPSIGYFSDKIMKCRKKVLILWLSLFSLPWILISFFTASINITLLYILSFWMGFFGCGNVVVFAIIKEQFPLEITGTAQSIVNVFPFVGAAIFQTFLGYILDLVGGFEGVYPVEAYSLAFKFVFACIIIVYIMSFFIKETMTCD